MCQADMMDNVTFNNVSVTWWLVLLVFNATFNIVSVMMDNVMTSFNGI